MEIFRKNSKILEINKSALLIVDIQERIVKVMRKHKKLVENTVKLIKGAKILELPIYYSEQYPQGLGETIPQIKNLLLGKSFQKISFSCIQADDIFAKLKKAEIEQVIVAGIESHVCVQQTVLDLLENDFQVNVVVDAISSRKKIDYQTAIKRMKNEGAVLATVESILFELLRISGTSNFKKVTQLIK